MAHPNEAASRAAKIADVLHIQTPSPWLTDRRCMPYCFRCLVLNDADVSAPRWKREWLEPTAEFCRVHHTLLERCRRLCFACQVTSVARGARSTVTATCARS